MTKLTAQNIQDYWAFMAQKYGSEVIDKDDSDLMQMVAGFLDLIEVQDKKLFMENYTTTIGDNIYIPFDLGVAGLYNLWDQIETGAHEHQHIIQLHREGPLKFSLEYLASKKHRAWYEAEAYRCDMEIYFWRTGRIMSPGQLANRLKNYGVDQGDIDFMEQYFEASAMTIQEGGIISEASQVTIEWLEKNCPEVREV